jgi:hypothetical protein
LIASNNWNEYCRRSYITTEMEVKQMMARLLAAITAGHEEMMAGMDAHYEKMIASQKQMMAKIDASHDACLGRMEANPEVKSEVEHEEVPKEDAAVATGRMSNKQHRG